jgi:hypothetical protein
MPAKNNVINPGYNVRSGLLAVPPSAGRKFSSELINHEVAKKLLGKSAECPMLSPIDLMNRNFDRTRRYG